MYYILNQIMNPNQIAMIGVLVAFILTFLGLKFPFSFLPVDHGREFAVNGALSKGKTRGVGLTFVCSFIISCVLFMPMDKEYIIYCILLFAMMLSGYLDDAAKTPWSDYKKGAIDLVLSIMTVVTFLNFNPSVLHIGSAKFALPMPVYFILAIILLWVSINVTNCSDGVDEALSVGDKQFQKKCFARVREIMEKEDVTVLFVTHTSSAAEEFCTRGIVLDHGSKKFDGSIEDAIAYYEGNY